MNNLSQITIFFAKNFSFNFISTPEPSSLLGLFLIGGAGFLAKKKQK
ncbi:MAG: PEP-CTERM sorting domain-containing protein [Crocosphaera sp.]